MAAVDTSIQANTWWTTGTSKGAGDGSSFDNRKTIPTGLGSLYVYYSYTLTLVLEESSGMILIGNNEVASKTMNIYGELKTVGGDNTFASLLPGGAYSSIRCIIGGTQTYKEASFYLTNIQIANLDMHQDAVNAATGQVCQFYGYGYAKNCTFKTVSTGYGVLEFVGGVTILDGCTGHGTSGGVGYVVYINGGLCYLVNFTHVTSGTNWVCVAGGYKNGLNIVGTLTQGGTGGANMYFNGGGHIPVAKYRIANIKTLLGGSPLSSVLFSGTEATGGIFTPLSCGASNSNGLCHVLSPDITNKGIWCLQKVDLYYRASAGAQAWASPVSSVNYGQYTFTFSKSGYVTQQQSHDFTDGADWGTEAAPIEITMVPTITTFIAAGGLWGTISYPNPWDNIKKVTCYASTLTIYDFLINVSLPFIVPTGGLTVYLYNEAGVLVSTPYTSTAPVSLTGGSTYDSLTTLTGLKSFTSPATPGKYMLACEVYDAARPSDYMWEQVWIEVLPTAPTITSPAISDSSIGQDERTTISCTTDGASGWVDILDGTGAVIYSKELTIAAGAGSAVIPGRYLDVGTYAAGQVVIHAVESTGALAAKDATLALEVTASSSSYQMQVALALQDVLQADSRLASIADEDIIVATDEAVVDQLHNYPAIIIIPDSDIPAPHSVTLRRHRCLVWVLIAAQDKMAKMTYGDVTEPDKVQDWVKAVVDVCEEECEDPDLRLGKLVQVITAAKNNPKVVPGKALYVAFIQVDAEILGK